MLNCDEATDEKSVCPIEERIALADVGFEGDFPYEWLDKNKHMSTYNCRKLIKNKGCNSVWMCYNVIKEQNNKWKWRNEKNDYNYRKTILYRKRGNARY